MNSLTSAVAAIVTDDAGRVLLCQQSQGHRRWGLPGGKVRENESPVHAAVRDIREETGMEIEMVDLVGLYQLDSCGQGLPDSWCTCSVPRASGEPPQHRPPGCRSPGSSRRAARVDHAATQPPIPTPTPAASGVRRDARGRPSPLEA